jgi:ribosomal protein L22
MATDIRAQTAFSRYFSAQKARLVIDLVRGKPAVEAMNTLKFMPHKRCPPGQQAAGFGCGQCRRKLWRQPRRPVRLPDHGR